MTLAPKEVTLPASPRHPIFLSKCIHARHKANILGTFFNSPVMGYIPRYGILASYHADRLHISQIQYYIELLTLYGPESGNNGRTCRRAGAATDQAFPFVHCWRSLHSEFMLKICLAKEKKKRQNDTVKIHLF